MNPTLVHSEPTAGAPPAAPLFPGGGRILLLDDARALRRALGVFLRRRGLVVVEAAEAAESLELLEAESFGVVVADLELPGAGGVGFLDKVRARRPDAEVLFTTSRPDLRDALDALRRGACDVLRKPFDFDEAAAALVRALERRELRLKTLELERLRERERVSEKHTFDLLAAMATLLDAKSKYTREHSDRVQEFSERLATAAGLPPARVAVIGCGGKVHDIGKVGIPDAILNKAGPLTPEERRTIERHPSVGEECLAPLPLMRPFVCMVGGHHENCDGSGYPRGLTRRELPVETLVVRIADYFDAVTSFRPYREPLSVRDAAELLRLEKGRGLDAELVEIFVAKVLPPHRDAPV